MPTTNYLTKLDLDLYTYGVFAQGHYKPVDALKLLAGIRADRFGYDVVNRKLPAASSDYQNTVVTPKLGPVWTVSPKPDLFSNLAEGIRSPAARQISPSSGGANAAVEPSRVRSIDVGFTALPTANWSASAAAYYTENENEIISVAPDERVAGVRQLCPHHPDQNQQSHAGLGH